MPAPALLARLIIALAICLVSISATAENDNAEVREWLDRMARAVETLNYRGTLVHWQDGKVDALRIIHRADESGIRERIYSLDGEPREILRDGKKIRCLMAGDQPLMLQSQLASRLMPNLPVNRIESPHSAYEMTIGGQERVAGMMTQVIEIKPLDQFRYGYRFWLEDETGMLLRSALMDHRGRAVQQVSFATIELGVLISDAELQPELDPQVMTEMTLTSEIPSSQPTDLNNASWLPPRVPRYFELVKVGTGESDDGDAFEHLVFSDGLASFSVYLEQGSSNSGRGRIESVGPVHIYTGLLEDRQVTVVGEVPAATVLYIGRSLTGSGEISHRY